MSFFLFCAVIVNAQTNDTNADNSQQIQYNYTSDLAYTEDFSGAIKMYKQMILFDKKNPVFYYKLGFAYLNTYGKSDSAIIFLRKADELYDSKYRADVSPIDIRFYLARAYSVNGKIDSSIIILENLRQETDNQQLIENINKELDLTRKFVNSLFTIEDLDSVINSSFSEHSPVYLPEKNILIFTSRRFNVNSTKYDDGQYDEDIYYSDWQDGAWSSPKLLTEFAGPDNEATSSVLSDKNELLIYKDDEDGSIYISKFENNQWTKPEKLPGPINTRHRETHASLTEDGNQIYFTSDRPGGYGGLDIWTSVKMSDGSWSKPVNLGDAVNSKGDEESPNISDDGKTLYFSSNGRGGYGGFDIFKAQKNEFGTWSKAENMGYPINSIGDDIFFSPIKSSDKAFYASYRYGSRGNADIFVVYMDDSTDVQTHTVNFGYVFDNDENPVDSVKVYIINDKTSDRAVATPTKSGKFIFVTEPNNTYTLQIVSENKILFTDKIVADSAAPKLNFYKKIKLTP